MRIDVTPGRLTVIVGLLLKRHRLSAQRLAAEQRHLATAVNNIPQGLVLYDASARIIICNKPYEVALEVLHQLRALGVRVALDDFGTGYSSLSYLQRFPFDKIKIDRAFIKDLAGAGAASSIVQAVVNIATASDMTTTAEGVETEQQRNCIFSAAGGYRRLETAPGREPSRWPLQRRRTDGTGTLDL